MRKYLLGAVCLWLIVACGNNNRSQTATSEDSNPPMLQDQLLHYWDSFPYADSMVWADTVRMRSTLTDWIQTLSQLPDSVSDRYARIAITAGHGHSAGQNALFQWLEPLLNDPNSPCRNEELFIPVLQAMIEEPLLSELDKARPRALLKQAMKNRKGTKASDLALITKDGRRFRLYDIHCEQILLYFFNPDCHDCKRVSEVLMSDPELQEKQQQGRLQVVAIYPDDDLTSWNRMENHYPSTWIVGRAPTQNAYILRAIPSVYVLDSTYTVLIKDAII